MSRGLTLVEVTIGVALIGVLASVAIVVYGSTVEEARITRAIADIRAIESELSTHEAEGYLPDTLDEIGFGDRLDPWGSPYRYLDFDLVGRGKGGGGLPGKARKDRFLVPLNSTYDLYSVGRDGDSKAPLAAKASHDDIVRAADGAFVGLATDF